MQLARPRIEATPRLVWAPQPGPQHALVECPVSEIFFGGARGGGKTDGVLGKWAIKAERYGKHFNGVLFRKEMPQADDLWERACEIYEPLGAKPLEHKKTIRFPNGARIRLRPLERVQDATKYQGQNLSDAAVEEAGNYPDPAPIDRLWGALRSTAGVPAQLLLTGNPGGPGQQWIAARYVFPNPRGMKVMERTLPNGAAHQFVFIPSKLQDNRALMEADPGYVNRLYLVGSAELVRAWLEGDWTAIEGAFFPEFSASRHVIDPIGLPAHWSRILAGDWGSARPFSFGWYAVSDGELARFPRGALIKYREWYGVKKDPSGAFIPNTGLKLDAEVVGKYLKRLNAGEHLTRAVIDPATFTADGGPSIAERLIAASGIAFGRADNRRVARAGAQGGWDQLRARLRGTHLKPVEGEGHPPMIFFTTNCKHTIRTLPAMQHDPVNAEDMDSDGEDHAPDETRYACMARPWVADLPESRKTLEPFTPAWLEYEEDHERKRVRYI